MDTGCTAEAGHIGPVIDYNLDVGGKELQDSFYVLQQQG
jgi:hypothetical protein